MLDAEERFNLWDGYKEKFDKLFSEVEWDKSRKFTDCGRNPDKDAPIVNKFFDILEKLSDFIDAHHKELYSELIDDEIERYNLRTNFEAWDAGICPKALRQMLIDEQNNIQEFKEFCKDFSPKEHQRVLELWRESRKMKASA